jgi:hypothetical protein
VSNAPSNIRSDLVLPFGGNLGSVEKPHTSVVDNSLLANVVNQVLRKTHEATADAGAGTIPQTQLNVAFGAIVCTSIFSAGALTVAAKSEQNGAVAYRISQRKFDFDKQAHHLKEARRLKPPARNNGSGNDNDSDIDD